MEMDIITQIRVFAVQQATALAGLGSCEAPTGESVVKDAEVIANFVLGSVAPAAEEVQS